MLSSGIFATRNRLEQSTHQRATLYYLKNLAREPSGENGLEWKDAEGNIILKMPQEAHEPLTPTHPLPVATPSCEGGREQPSPISRPL